MSKRNSSRQVTSGLIDCVALCFVLLLCSATSVWAQSANKEGYPRVEGFVGYSALGEAGSRGIDFGGDRRISANYSAEPGFEMSFIRNFNRHFGIKGDFSAHFNNESGRSPITTCTPDCTTVTQDFELKTRVYDFLAGPEFKARNSTRFTPFAHLLAGVAHLSADFTTPGPTLNLSLRTSKNSFAMGMGGGFDIRVTKRVSFRALMDYNPVFINDSTTGTRDLVRISLGVLIH